MLFSVIKTIFTLHGASVYMHPYLSYVHYPKRFAREEGYVRVRETKLLSFCNTSKEIYLKGLEDIRAAAGAAVARGRGPGVDEPRPVHVTRNEHGTIMHDLTTDAK